MKELVIRYSDYDGSSKGVREWMRTNLVKFAESNPELMIKTELKRCVHPFVRGNYANGNSKTICIKNLHPDNITSYVNDLRNQIGRKVPVDSTSCSVECAVWEFIVCGRCCWNIMFNVRIVMNVA